METVGEVQYSIVPSDNRFSIDNKTGTIVTGSETIDWELIDNSTITLTVRPVMVPAGTLQSLVR